MKVKCPMCNGEPESMCGKNCQLCGTKGYVNVEVDISTADLIAELERRRPVGCPDKCQHLGSELCGGCYWSAFLGEDIGHTTDNFKADKGGK